MYLCAADEAGSVPDVFRVLGQLTEAENQRASEPLINEVMPTLLGASEKATTPEQRALACAPLDPFVDEAAFSAPKPLC